MNDYLKISDFSGIGQLAIHCDKKKLDISINQAMEFDIKPLLGCLFLEVKKNWDEESYSELIEGSDFAVKGGFCSSGSCGHHEGLKTVLAYYSYSRYLMLNQLNDTPNGNVSKSNDFSFPTDSGILKTTVDNYRNMARDVWGEVRNFLLANSDKYPNFAEQETRNKGFGIRIKNISR